MSADTNQQLTSPVRYEPDEAPPNALALGLGIQLVVLCVGGVIFTPTIIVNAAGLDDPTYLGWAVFACLVVTAITTAVQAFRVGYFGAGYPIFMGTSGSFIAISVAALTQGGPMLLAMLVVASSLFQFFLATRLALLRKIVTPAVSGTVIMLIPVSVVPIVFDMLTQTPEGTTESGAAITAAVTMGTIVVLGLLGKGMVRLWSPFIGAVVGSIVGAYFGLFDFQRVLDASWIGLPLSDFPALDFSVGTAFWSLLPAFVIVTIVGAVESIGDAVAIQEVGHRENRAADYRVVQRTVATDGLGNLLSGFLATVPNTTYSSSIAVAELTGVCSRRVGMFAAGAVATIAVLPKLQAIILGVPNAVVAAYLLVLLAMLFVVGTRFVVRSGVDYRQVIVVGVAFWLGVGFQGQLIFPNVLNDWWLEFLSNGMTAGGIAAILMSGLMALFRGFKKKLVTVLDSEAIRQIDRFIADYGDSARFEEEVVNRLRLVSEEVITSLLMNDQTLEEEEANMPPYRDLQLAISREGREMVLEFVASAGSDNLEDRLFVLENTQNMSSISTQQEISLKIISELSSQVTHQQYQTTEYVTVRVDTSIAA